MTEEESKTKKVIPINKYSIYELKSGVDQNISSVINKSFMNILFLLVFGRHEIC